MFTTLLVPIDGSATAEAGLHEALKLAKGLGARVVLLTVIDDLALLMESTAIASHGSDQAQLRRQGEKVLDAAAAEALRAGVPAELALRQAPLMRAADTILAEAVARHCDLIVMGTHGRKGVARLALGSDAEKVARASDVPVMLVRHAGPKSL